MNLTTWGFMDLGFWGRKIIAWHTWKNHITINRRNQTSSLFMRKMQHQETNCRTNFNLISCSIWCICPLCCIHWTINNLKTNLGVHKILGPVKEWDLFNATSWSPLRSALVSVIFSQSQNYSPYFLFGLS